MSSRFQHVLTHSIAPTVAMLAGIIGGIVLARDFPLGPNRQQDAALLTDTVAYVASHYVDPVTRSKLIDGAIEGMFNRLDPHSKYLEVESMSALQAEAHGRYAGIGIEVSLVDDWFTVVSTMADSPAQRADVLPGDRITSVDGESLRGERLGDLVQKLRGPAGSRVALHLIRDDTGRDVELTRERIELASISITEPRAGILLLRVSLFHDHTAEEIRDAIGTALEKATPLHGLVLDLRGNPGGLLTSAVEVSDLFIDQGLIVRTAGRSDESHVSYAATPGDVIAGRPIGVLIDAGTASAAEVVAAALQDHERAVIFGTRSYGKGSVQTLFRVPGERGIKLTTARYFGPSGRSIDGIGVQPDVIWQGDYETLTTHAVERLAAETTIPAPV